MAKNKSIEAGAVVPVETPELVTVRVLGQRINEDSVGYEKGETFQTTAERAAALAGLVEITTSEPAAEPV